MNYQNYLEFKKQEALAKKIFKRVKRESWRSFCESLTPLTPIDRIWSGKKFQESISK